ncbi:phosphoribosylanthranilate isomerase [Sphingomonas bacterium]|uniref:phosphoribosylanthranilate isomerase n=1 Tax=Sphingomonas bacterium TaxID=1895847 RepID=UPI002605BB8D|nr:phosphoribosylanthranilate isomerase [Sphingomonas bacterium]
MPITAKICGLSTPETVDAAIGGGASHLGFNFFPPSPRAVSFDTVAGLAARVPPHVTRVGVYVDPDDELLERSIAAGQLDAVQLHRVTPDRAAAVRARFARKLWAVVAVKSRTDLDQARGYAGAADCILYDARTPDDAALPGGMGVRFDWTLLEGFRHPLPWALSGGLDASNVGEAIHRTGATLVDVSSGVETAPGVKDAGLIAAFLKEVASAF